MMYDWEDFETVTRMIDNRIAESLERILWKLQLEHSDEVETRTEQMIVEEIKWLRMP